MSGNGMGSLRTLQVSEEIESSVALGVLLSGMK